jgi:hypothetical protein
VTKVINQQGQSQSKDATIESWQGKTYSISFGKMKRIGSIWTVATATPIEQLTEPVKLLSRLVIYAGCVGLLLALGLSWFGSRQFYEPIRRLVLLFRSGTSNTEGKDEIDYIASEWKNLSRESQILQERIDTHLPSLRESFLLQLVQGHLYFLNDEEIIDRMEQYGWEVREKIHAVMVLQIDGLYSSDGKFAPGDEQLVTFAASNILEEITSSKSLAASIINFQDLTVGLLFSFDLATSKEELKSKLYHLAEELASTLHQFLKVNTTVCVGKSAESIRSVPDLFDDSRKALSHRKLNEQQQILYMDEMMPEGQHRIMYPFDIEKEIVHALRMGMEIEIYQGMDDFSDRAAAAGR